MLYKKSALELGQMLREKKCSATEIIESVYSRIDTVENDIQAYITLTKEEAFKQAQAVDFKISSKEKISLLAGIPIAVKDNICTKNILTTCASKMLSNFSPPYNATAVCKLLENNMVITGKVNMDEFAMGSSCENSYFKKTKNPHNTDYVPGGSSGGSAAVIASGEAILSLGSDTGGSIRQPASLCGVVGLKPTYGTVSRYGLIAFASSLDQIGPLGKTVDDVSLLYNAIAGKDEYDATSLDVKPAADVQNIKIGIPEEYFGDGVDSKVKESVMEAVKELEKNGATIVKISLPSTSYALSAYYIISSAEASSNLARFDGVKYGYRAECDNLSELYLKTRSEGFGDEVKRRIMLGTFVLSSGYYDAYYKRAKLLQQQISAEFSEAFTLCDVIITPTSPSTAFKLGENINEPLKMYAADICTVTVNISGLPAISVPCGKINGLPVGMQIIGSKFSENLLFKTAKQYENIVGGFKVI